MAFRPSRWILYSPVAVLPFFAALFLDAPRLHDDLLDRVTAAVGDPGKGWANLALDGRDVTLTGDSPSDEQLAAVVAAVQNTAGVRKLENRARIVYPPPAAPTVAPASGVFGSFAVSGTWPEGDGNTLKVALGDESAVFGSDKTLTSDGRGNWSFKPSKLLEPGTYDLSATVTSAKGVSASDSSKDEVTIAVPPALNPPTIEKLESNAARPVLKGSWDPAVARSLSVSVGDTLYMLGDGSALTAKDGSWSLAFPAELADGAYDVLASVTDDFGRTAKTELKGGLLVDTTPPAAPVIDAVSKDLPLKVTGSWPGKDAVSLVVSLAGKVWTLGKDAALTSDGAGHWSFAPDVTLKPGTYDLGIEIADRLGNVSRDSTKDEVVIPEPPPLTPPTVESVLTNKPQPVIRGTWPSAAATALSVTLGDTAYELGKSPELTTSADHWTLTLAKPLADGAYDIAVTVADALGRSAASAAPGRLTIDTVAPAAPTLTPFSGEAPVKLSGTWGEGDAASLGVTLDSQGWVLGKDQALASDGKGNWSLDASGLTLEPGPHKVTVTTADAAGNESKLESADGVTLVPPPPPPPEMAMPTVEPLVADVPRPVLHGAFSEDAAKTLSVWLAGRSYDLGTAPELVTDGKGRWTLSLSEPLSDGTYEVVVTTSDGKGLALTDSTRDELTVDAHGPGTPTVDLFAGETSPAEVSGSFDSAGTTAFTISVPDAAVSGSLTQGLTVKGDSWSLALPQPLKPGSHDVVAEAADAKGRIARDQTRFEIFIKEPAPPPPPAPEMKAPTVNTFSGDKAPEAVTGTFDEAVTKTLAVTIDGAGVRETLGSGTALTSDGKGNWSLKLPATLAPGVYDVAVTATDGAGKTLSDSSTAELYIKAPPPPPPPPPAPEMKAPTVNAFSGDKAPEAVTGTFDEAVAKTLAVTIDGAGVKETLGSGTALTSDGQGNWSLKLPATLAPGVYDVAVTSTDAAGKTLSDSSTAELYIKAPPPPPPPPPTPEMKAPTIDAYSGEVPKAITGTWDEAVAKSLKVSIGGTGIAAALGADAALSSDGKGKWTLALSAPIAPGTYDVRAEAADAAGKTVADATAGELVITAKTAPPPEPPPLDCDAAFAGLPRLRFDFNHISLTDAHRELLAAAAKILLDPACAGRRVELTGYADYWGSHRYNDWLSLERAKSVAAGLETLGVEASRLDVKGSGERDLEDPTYSREAWAKNRRVIMTLLR